MNTDALQLIKKFEGKSLVPYRCPGGYWTVGWGHRMLRHEPFGPLTEGQAISLLKQDIDRCQWMLSRMILVPLTQTEEGALLSFLFNVGAGAFQRSTLRMKVNRKEHDAAADEFKRWVWSRGKKLPGLVVRRAEESLRYQRDR